MSACICGKALLVLTRRDNRDGFQFDVSAYIQSSSGGGQHRDGAQEEFYHLEYDVLPAPAPAYRLQVGETMRIAVVYEIVYHHYSDGEVDVDLHYDKVRVRRHQRPKKRYVTGTGSASVV